MPNWIEGNMKVRGKSKDVYNFLSRGIHLYDGKWSRDGDGAPVWKSNLDKNGVLIDVYDDACEITLREGCYIEGTHRAFVSEDEYIDIGDITSNIEITIVIPIKQAWGFVPENYQRISDEYNVDIKLIGWESGMCYKAECEVLRGCEATYTETTYDDWNWETECPTFGG